MPIAVFIVSILFFAYANGLNLEHTVPIAERTLASTKWTIVGPAHPTEKISFKVNILEATFWEVSDPQHPNYGKFLSVVNVNELIAPELSSVNNVLAWITTRIPADAISVFPTFIHVTTTAEAAANLFNTSFYWYELKGNARRLIRINGVAHMPAGLVNDVDLILGLSELFHSHNIRPVFHYEQASTNLVTPGVLKSYPQLGQSEYILPHPIYYRIPVADATSKKNLQAAAEFGTFFSLGALAAFDKFLGLTTPNVTREGTNCFPDCDQTQADIDIQYSTAMGSGVPTTSMSYEQGEWVLDWTLATNTLSTPPLVASISYGWAELDQCELTDSCVKLGYNSLQYVNRTNVEFQALGVKGVSIIVASGDDGAPSLAAASGNCPMDHTEYCPNGGCAHMTSDCTEITVTLVANKTSCFFPMGLGNDICAQMVDDPNWNLALEVWIKANNECRIALESDSEYEPHIYSTCTCDKLKTVTANGFEVSQYVFNQTQGSVFSAIFPASSPYVTSVGATQFNWDNDTIASESVASIISGSYITSGGGFSSFLSQPSYQTTLVANYLKSSSSTLPPLFSFNPKMRAYPDVAFGGHNFVMFESNNTANLDICPCAQYFADGTGCSSPSFAGMVSLVNDKLLNAGKSPLGFLNPLLYQMAAAKPSAFHDITSGSNSCNRVYCCTYGYTAASGWDPVTGLGTPNYSDFEAYIMSVKNVTH